MLSSSFLASRGLGCLARSNVGALARAAEANTKVYQRNENPALAVFSRGVKIPRRWLDPTWRRDLGPERSGPFYQVGHQGELKPEIEEFPPVREGFEDEVLTEEQKQRREEVISLVDSQISSSSTGRLFGVILIGKNQRKVTAGDLVMVDDDFGLENGQTIRLDKVLMVGGRDFSLLGRPLLPRDLVKVEATVVERNLSRTEVSFRYGRSIARGTTKLNRKIQTTLRITNVDLLCPIEDAVDRLGFERREDDPAVL